MSRIYDNQPLTNLPLNHIDVPGQWSAISTDSGNGVILEAVIQKRAHFVVTDSTKTKKHYYIFFVKCECAHRRKFDEKGQEIEPNFSDTKKVNTGYLNSSYKTEAKGITDKLSDEDMRSVVNKPELTKHTDKHGSPGFIALWLEEETIARIEFELGDKVRVKTRGDGPFVSSITKLDQQSVSVSNYAGGEDTGSAWTSKIMQVKQQTESKSQAENEGVDDDEWDD